MNRDTTPHQVESILARALTVRASDIHIEPQATRTIVRARVDGLLEELATIPHDETPAAISRVKILADLDIAERRRPQDGRFEFDHDRQRVDVRVSTLPSVHGEKLVLRLLRQAGERTDFADIGMDDTDRALFESTLAAAVGMVLVTGPTGSGKTTTLYAALQHLNSPQRNIVTVEDPVERRIAGITQVQAAEEIGYGFPAALRAFLRQDPDVIMVGEIRDRETAEIAFRAALTGHLVLSTLHTEDTASTIVRLVDMGIAPFLIASCLRLVVAQRLTRLTCRSCAGAGGDCANCQGRGVAGRTGIFEMLAMTDALRAQILRGVATAEIRREAKVRRTLDEQASGYRRSQPPLPTKEGLAQERHSRRD